MKLKFYSDPGHGWVAVKILLLQELRIADRISGYSYIKGKTAYLEEDCDASLLLATLKENNVAYTIVEKSTNKVSPIRGYRSYAS